MACQCYHSVEQIVKFDSAAIETKTLLLEKSVDAILTEIYDAAAQLPHCKKIRNFHKNFPQYIKDQSLRLTGNFNPFYEREGSLN